MVVVKSGRVNVARFTQSGSRDLKLQLLLTFRPPQRHPTMLDLLGTIFMVLCPVTFKPFTINRLIQKFYAKPLTKHLLD